MVKLLSTGQAARMLRVPRWQIMDLFDRGLLPEVQIVAGRRLVPAKMLPEIKAALERRRCPAPDPTPLNGLLAGGGRRD